MVPEMVKNYVNFCTARENHDDTNLNLSKHRFLYPTLLLPTLSYVEKNNLKVTVHPNVYGYVKRIINPSNWRNKTYVPFAKLPINKNKRNNILDDIDKALNKPIGGREAFDYIMYELTDNIYLHSNFNNAYIMAQRYDNKRFGEICFLDDGITIPGNFSRYEIDYEEDVDAIKQAINGVSTQDEFNHRGFSLNNIMSSFTKAGNEMFIASRYGAIYINQFKSIEYPLKEKHKMNGTLVSLRVFREVTMKHEESKRKRRKV